MNKSDKATDLISLGKQGKFGQLWVSTNFMPRFVWIEVVDWSQHSLCVCGSEMVERSVAHLICRLGHTFRPDEHREVTGDPKLSEEHHGHR